MRTPRASYFIATGSHTARLRLCKTRVLRDMRSESSTSRHFEEDSQTSFNSQATTLKGEKSNKTGAGATAAGTLFGAIALITGSTVGAGMLALPEVTAPAGFGPTAAGLIATWALLVAEALLMAEVNLELLQQAKPEDAGKIVTLRQMAVRTLGQPGKIVTVIYLLLSYCLLVAYLAKASEVLDYFAGHTLAPTTSASLLCASIGGLFLLGGPNAADRLNQALTSVLFLFFVGILGVGITQNDVLGSLANNPSSWSNLSPAIPILFLSLVYHDLVPFICSYLGGDRKLVRSALVLGSLVPLFMFLSWEAVALSLVPGGLVLGGGGVTGGGLGDYASAAASVQEIALTTGAAAVSTVSATVSATMNSIKPLTVDPLQVFVHRSGPGVGLAIECFSFLAVITSFTGTVMGLSETLRSEVPSMIQSIGTFIGSESLASYDMPGTSTTSTKNSSTDASVAAAVGSPSSERVATTIGIEVEELGDDDQQQGFLYDSSRVLALALTLGPPLAFTAENPGAFLAVLSIAGGYGMTALYGVMPPVMAWKLRNQMQQQQQMAQMVVSSENAINSENPPQLVSQAIPNKSGYPTSSSSPSFTAMMPGGVPALAGVLAAAVGVGLSRVAADADAAVEVVTRLTTGSLTAEEVAMAEGFMTQVEVAATGLATVATSIFATAPL